MLEETPEYLIRVHFLGSELDYTSNGADYEPYPSRGPTFRVRMEDWKVVSRIFTRSEIKRVVKRLKPFRSAVDDKIFPALF